VVSRGTGGWVSAGDLYGGMEGTCFTSLAGTGDAVLDVLVRVGAVLVFCSRGGCGVAVAVGGLGGMGVSGLGLGGMAVCGMGVGSRSSVSVGSRSSVGMGAVSCIVVVVVVIVCRFPFTQVEPADHLDEGERLVDAGGHAVCQEGAGGR